MSAGPPARGRWVRRPLLTRASAASAVPPPFAVPILCCLAVLGAVDDDVRYRPLYVLLAASLAVPWLLSATAWVRVGTKGLLWRHLGRIRLVRWESVTGCATVWADQGRKQVRVVALELGPGHLLLLWPTAWIGEPNRRALVEVVQQRRPPPVRSAR